MSQLLLGAGRSGGGVPRSFFVNASTGNDSNSGLTTAAPWLTIAKVNASLFNPGDTIAFARGQTFTGSIILPSSGNTLRQITVGAYGSGAAPIISSGTAKGFVATNKSRFTVRDLELLGNNGVTASIHGVHVINTLADDSSLRGIKLINLEVSEYGGNGIWVDAQDATLTAAGFDDVLIDNCDVHDCTHNIINGTGSAGILVQSQSYGYPFANVVISNCTSHDNLGTAGDTNWNGSGIFLGECATGLIEGCVAYNNGELNTNEAGPTGIWTGFSDAVVIRNCESYDNHTGAGTFDGGGFDMDGACTNCITEYCYAHDNHGAGFMLFNYEDATLDTWSGNTVRFCVSENDGLGADSSFGIFIGADQNITGVRVHNNVVFQSGDSTKTCLHLESTVGVGSGNFEGYVANNIFITTNGAALVGALGINPANMRLRGNDYYASGTFLINWNGADYASLAAWQAVATSQEKISAVNVGLTVNPLLVNAGGGGTINADNSLLNAYTLQVDSPMLGAGLDLLTSFSIDPGPTNFFGDPISAPFDVGACGETVLPFKGLSLGSGITDIVGETNTFTFAAQRIGSSVSEPERRLLIGVWMRHPAGVSPSVSAVTLDPGGADLAATLRHAASAILLDASSVQRGSMEVFGVDISAAGFGTTVAIKVDTSAAISECSIAVLEAVRLAIIDSDTAVDNSTAIPNTSTTPSLLTDADGMVAVFASALSAGVISEGGWTADDNANITNSVDGALSWRGAIGRRTDPTGAGMTFMETHSSNGRGAIIAVSLEPI